MPVFYAPGANANAVKELVLAGLLIAARNLAPALDFVQGLGSQGGDLEQRVEEGKKAFAGIELPGHTLGVIGLGKIGSLVADAAIRLGMHVIGYDPEITVDAAWSLPSQVRRANSVDELLKASHFVTLHVPLLDKTRHLVSARNIEHLRAGAILLNFSREGVVDEAAVLKSLRAHRLRSYVTDFPSPGLLGQPGVVALPHLGASTREAEENSAVMVVDQVCDYLEHGNIRHAVNFPEAVMTRESPYRLAIANANVPNMLARISHAMGSRRINIHNMLNKSRGEMAYTLADVDSRCPRRCWASCMASTACSRSDIFPQSDRGHERRHRQAGARSTGSTATARAAAAPRATRAPHRSRSRAERPPTARSASPRSCAASPRRREIRCRPSP